MFCHTLLHYRCVQTIRVHTEAVWALLATDTFSHVISGGRDRQVIVTELRNPLNSTVVCVETAPVLRLCFAADMQSIWVRTVIVSVSKVIMSNVKLTVTGIDVRVEYQTMETAIVF